MPSPSPRRSAEWESLAHQTGFSIAAIESMDRSIVDGGGRMAQFDHPEFGGAGQWMQGGLLMIADFSDGERKGRIARLCEALSAAIASGPAEIRSAGGQFQRQSSAPQAVSGASVQEWYPASLGTPDSSGAQDGARYAWFSQARRLAIDDGGSVTVYDTGDHRIGGVSQQQGADRAVAFVSQDGALDVSRLPVVDRLDGPAGRAIDAPSDAATHDVPGDPFVGLEKLAGLHARGILDDDEFTAKKAELLRRI